MSLNLLPSQAKFRAVLMKMKAKANLVTKIIIIVWIVVVVVVMALWWGAKWWLQAENGKYKKTVDAYLSLADTIVTSQIVKFRAKLLGKVLAERFEYSAAFNRVGTLFGNEVEVSEFKIEKESVFNMKLRVDKGLVLDQVEKQVQKINDGEEEGLKRAEISKVIFRKISQDWEVLVEVELK